MGPIFRASNSEVILRDFPRNDSALPGLVI